MQSYHPYHSSLKTHALLQNNMNAKMRLSPSRILSCFVSLHKAETFVPDLWYLFNIRIGFSILLDCSSFFSIRTWRFSPYVHPALSAGMPIIPPLYWRLNLLYFQWTNPLLFMDIFLLDVYLFAVLCFDDVILSRFSLFVNTFLYYFSDFLFLFFCLVFSLLIFVLF